MGDIYQCPRRHGECRVVRPRISSHWVETQPAALGESDYFTRMVNMRATGQRFGIVGPGSSTDDGGNAPEVSVDRLATNRQRQLRALITLTAVGILAIALVFAVAARVLIQRFEHIEREDALQKAAQLYHAADADFRQLAIANRNNAEWDDAVDFVATRNPSFISSNFTATTLGELHIDLAWIVDRNGNSLFSGLYDRTANSLASPAPASLLDQFQGFLKAPRPAAGQVLRTSLGPMAVSAIEISRTDRSQPTGAIMLAARFVGAEEIARIGETSQLPLSITNLPDLKVRPASLPEAVFNWAAAHDPLSTTMAWVLDRHAIYGYALIRDYEGMPVAVLSTPSPRNIYALGLRTTWWLLGSISTVLILFTSAILLLILRLRRTFADNEAAQQRLRRLTRQLQDMVILVDPKDLRVLDANEAMLRKMNCSLEQLRTRTVAELYPELTPDKFYSTNSDPQGALCQATPLMTNPDSPLLADVTVSRLQDSDREFLCFVGTDVTHRQRVELLQRDNQRRLSHMAQHDALTSLPNRLYLRTRLRRAMQRAVGGDKLNAVYYLDIDDFKVINDSRGHAIGDRLLQVVAKRLRAIVHMRDVVARIGGDEFVVVAPLLPDMQAVEALAVRLQVALQAPIVIDHEALSVSASIGIALYPDHGTDIESVLKHADIAMSCAKAAGKRYEVFTVEMTLRVKEQADLVQSLRHALGTSQFYMEYQPIVDLRTGRVASLEALVSWQHPELGLIPPGLFIAAAEGSNQMLELGQHILEMVFADLRHWLDDNVPIVPVAINISPQQLERSDFADLVARLSKDKGVEQRWVQFELTENVLLNEPERVNQALKQLRINGSRVLIDDFGTGYSSLTYLNKLPVDALKIDQAFVHDVTSSATRLPIIRAIIEMAHHLGLSTVAEGVENGEQLVLLTEQGCDFAQGYFLSRPMTAQHCRVMLEQMRGEGLLTETIMARALSSG